MAGGGRVLAANDPEVHGPALLKRLVGFIARLFHTSD
jgi:hypothetical protein